MELTKFHTRNITGSLYESRRIILSRFCHFLTLSLFFLPLSFSITKYTLSRFSLPDEPYTLVYIEDHSNHQKHVTYYLFYTLLIHVLALCAIGTITYSTHHAFFGKPVKILDALKSLTFSFFRLASTIIAAYILVVMITLSVILFVATVIMLVHNLGFVDIDYYYVYFPAIMGVILLVVIICFPVNWSLAFAVVVVESKWGFAPLIRSSYLAKGMRSVSRLVRLYFVVFVGLMVMICSANVMALTMIGSIVITMFLLWIIAANTVLYNYCKALHGELELEAVEGFGHDYMNLPSDLVKVPHIVSVVTA
ncbi:hypothetical protein HanRHA438_Chr12g0543581 [Helianthus annuus]|nr:hypothetical protein HanOQP8_Chr12g0439311 [Helianthus annuus]KAJ0865715.1 hypothetical protein HanRHA438_Chr12g0543581 [Helianthus annuus]